jgi:hypothetical protein
MAELGIVARVRAALPERLLCGVQPLDEADVVPVMQRELLPRQKARELVVRKRQDGPRLKPRLADEEPFGGEAGLLRRHEGANFASNADARRRCAD